MAYRAGTDLILIGSDQNIDIDYRQVQQRFATPIIRATLAPLELTTPGCLLARHYLYNEEPLLQLAGTAPLNTDDWPILEFSARYNLGEKTLGQFQSDNLALLQGSDSPVSLPLTNLGRNRNEIARALHDISSAYQRAGRPREAGTLKKRALEYEAQFIVPSLSQFGAGPS